MHNSAYLVQYERGSYSPSNPVLEVCVSGDQAFLAIGRADGDFTHRTFTASEQVSVDVEELLDYLTAMRSADERQAAERREAAWRR